ncbi:MAG: DegT/DnrJ/EryC1/StrS family aminotransferase [Candidatus Bathyarchaeia archaeon]|jgi:dTDP-4-amino-4,6-dideoxygalactose transaminase
MKKLKLTEPVVGEDELEMVREVLESGWLTEGSMTRKLEEQVKEFLGVKYAVATTSCTSALELSLRALDIGFGDEVIIPDFTHPATGNVVKWIGAEPILVDVDLNSYNIDSKQVEKAITKKTRCIIPVSWGGNPLDISPLLELKEKYNLFIVEDAACSLGSEFNGKKTGSLADITCFSFHPRKVITTGEGGMAVTNSRLYAERLGQLKKFGIKTTDGQIEFVGSGINCKLSDVLGAIGVAQMKKLDAITKRRIELASNYNELLREKELVRIPEKRKEAKHIYQTYAAYIKRDGVRDKIIADLGTKNIETQIGTFALHLQPSYKQVRRIGKLERAEELYRNLLALPMCHSMTYEDQKCVVAEVQNSLNRHS